MTPELAAACAQAVHVISSDGKTLRAGRAVLFVMDKLGWRVFARLLALPPMLWIVEFTYRIVANNRPFFARYFFRHD